MHVVYYVSRKTLWLNICFAVLLHRLQWLQQRWANSLSLLLLTYALSCRVTYAEYSAQSDISEAILQSLEFHIQGIAETMLWLCWSMHRENSETAPPATSMHTKEANYSGSNVQCPMRPAENHGLLPLNLTWKIHFPRRLVFPHYLIDDMVFNVLSSVAVLHLDKGWQVRPLAKNIEEWLER